MGTLGSKIGCVVGILVAALLAVPVVHFIPGSCFFEGGCGEGEQVGLTVAALIVIALAVTSAVVTKALVNYILRRQTH